MLYSIHLIDSYDQRRDVGSVVPIDPAKKELILQLAGDADGESAGYTLTIRILPFYFPGNKILFRHFVRS